MTPEKQRIAIAEACGAHYLIYEGGEGWLTTEDYEHAEQKLSAKDFTGDRSKVTVSDIIPDYLNDLNAIQKAVKKLPLTQRDTFIRYLSQVTQRSRMATVCWTNATAKADQLSEAFLRTIGKWVE